MQGWEIQHFNTIQDHDGTSMHYRRRASTVPNDPLILLVNSWICHPLTKQSNSSQCMEDEKITSGQRARIVIKLPAFD